MSTKSIPLLGTQYFHECLGKGLPLICAACGFENQIGEKYCGGCGHALKTVQAGDSDPVSDASAQSGAAAASGAATGAAATAAASGSVPSRQQRAGDPERRYLSVVFCDLVGSTDLSGRIDPEDLRLVIRAYQRVVSGAIHRYEGYVVRFFGDGIMAYFGYPSPHENDAERALRAGLEVIAAVGRLNAEASKPNGVHYAVRVGVATGLVVVGDLIGEGSAADEKAVVGEMIQRLESLSVLMLATWRPEFEPPWSDSKRIITLCLHRLSREASERIVSNAAGGKRLPAEVADRIVAKTGGGQARWRARPIWTSSHMSARR